MFSRHIYYVAVWPLIIHPRHPYRDGGTRGLMSHRGVLCVNSTCKCDAGTTEQPPSFVVSLGVKVEVCVGGAMDGALCFAFCAVRHLPTHGVFGPSLGLSSW